MAADLIAIPGVFDSPVPHPEITDGSEQFGVSCRIDELLRIQGGPRLCRSLRAQSGTLISPVLTSSM